jgi:hypothetical protein
MFEIWSLEELYKDHLLSQLWNNIINYYIMFTRSCVFI